MYPSTQPERQTVLHSWCTQSEWSAPTVVGGAGAWLHIDDGRRILDMSSLAECSNLGHQHPHLVAAIQRQAGQLCFVNSAWGARPRAQLAGMLLERCGFAGGRSARHVADLIDARGSADIAAVMMEPDAGANGIVAPPNYWPALRELTRRRGVFLIADEVMSGFGRCGEWFAWQRHGEARRPDLMTLAKGLTGAHVPLGAVVLSAAVAQRLENEMLYTGLTYCGHPLACAAGVAALEAYEREDLIARSRTLGAQLLRRLHELQARHPVIGDVRGGAGLFAVVELVRDRTTREPLSSWPEVHPALERNVSFAFRGNLILLAPPLVIGENELENAIGLLDELLGGLDATSPATVDE